MKKDGERGTQIIALVTEHSRVPLEDGGYAEMPGIGEWTRGEDPDKDVREEEVLA